MSILKFSDGEEFDTSCEPRIETRKDGLYVMGNGYLIPVANRTEANQQLNIISPEVMEVHSDRLTNSILSGSLRSNFINVKEANDPQIREGAFEVAQEHSDDEEIGSSDMTFIKAEFLTTIERQWGWTNNRLTLKD